MGRFGVMPESLEKIARSSSWTILNELLAGADRGEHLRAERLGVFHLVAKFLRDLVIHVGREQGQAHLAHGIATLLSLSLP